ncbi:MAG: TetR/AcrR family transcriptional regulator [Deltaproteobacteria bacterium]|nr:TetR/AcrR family transcriptional regulator [Deltaproteobacteria bacterium]
MGKKTTPEKIYETALKVFAKYGFRRTRVKDITGELDMATGTLYLYVKNKKDLYEKTVSHGIKKWQEKVFEAIADIDDVREQFLAMCKRSYGYLAEDVNLRQVLINDPSIFPLSPRKVRFPEIDTASINLIKEILQKGIKQQIFRNIDVDRTAEFFYSIYVMFIIKTYVKSEGQSAQKMFDEGLDLMLNGLIKKAAGGQLG